MTVLLHAMQRVIKSQHHSSAVALYCTTCTTYLSVGCIVVVVLQCLTLCDMYCDNITVMLEMSTRHTSNWQKRSHQ